MKPNILGISNEYMIVIIFLVNCQWYAWNEWTSCSYSCGTGARQRSRQVKTRAKNGGEPCLGSDTQIERCVIKSCAAG